MQRSCTVVLRTLTYRVAMEPPVSLSENFENVVFGGFSKTRTIFIGRRVAGGGGRLNSLQSTTDGSCGTFDGFHRTEDDQGSD